MLKVHQQFKRGFIGALHNHCSKMGASRQTTVTVGCPSCPWLAADRLTPASSCPPYHYHPCLSNQHVEQSCLPTKCPAQPWNTLLAYTSDRLSSTHTHTQYVLQHFSSGIWTISFYIFCFSDVGKWSVGWSQCPCPELKLRLLLHSCLLPVLLQVGGHQISLCAGHSMYFLSPPYSTHFVLCVYY